MMEAYVNDYGGKEGLDPFVSICTGYVPNAGYMSLAWLTTPAELRRLADELEKAFAVIRPKLTERNNNYPTYEDILAEGDM